MNIPTRYALLRDRRTWKDAAIKGLSTDADGYLSLLRIPGSADGQPIELPPPYDAGTSGIVGGPCQSLFVADTVERRLIFLDGLCQVRGWIPPKGQSFIAPTGLAICQETLWVADSGLKRILGFRLPGLEYHATIDIGLQNPVSIACDSRNRLYVLDAGLAAIQRFTGQRLPDTDYNAKLGQEILVHGPTGMTFSPVGFVIANDDTLYVTEASTGLILHFDSDGYWLSALPAAFPGWKPRALAAYGGLLYVFDAAQGRVLVLDRQSGDFLGVVMGYRGPVTALSISLEGKLFIKPGFDAVYYEFIAGVDVVQQGAITAGPLDAGESSEWFRAFVDAELLPDTEVRLEVFQSDTPSPAPTASDWRLALSLDTLLNSLTVPSLTPYLRRFIWLRATLYSGDGRASPVMKQLRAETAGENYLDYLPPIYQKSDIPDGFLFRLLHLARTQLSQSEEMIDLMARMFTPEFTPADALPWLADWLAFELPDGLDVEQKRKLLYRVFHLYDRRGTAASLREIVRLYTGVDVVIIEHFYMRSIWQLGLEEGSRLGFDTVLPAIDPNGLVIPDPMQETHVHSLGCSSNTIIGSSVVGESAPVSVEDIGETLFADTAYRFSVLVPAYKVNKPGIRETMVKIIEQEKPAHTAFHLCLIEPSMRIGFQARIGVDTIVASGCTSAKLADTNLNQNFLLGETQVGPGRIGNNTRLGQTTLLG